MFSFRKRKREEEDEPLVPHGLVWQATETPEEDLKPEAAQEPSSKDSPPPPPGKAAQELHQQPRPLELPVKASPGASAIPDGPIVRREPIAAVNRIGSISPPKAWPSPRVQELTRRAQEKAVEGTNALRLPLEPMQLQTAEEADTRPDQPQQLAVNVSPALVPPAPVPLALETEPSSQNANVTEIRQPRKPVLSGTLTLVRQELNSALSSIGQELRELRAKAGQNFRSLQLRKRLDGGRTLFTQQAADARTKFVSLSDQAKARSGAWKVSASTATKENLRRSTAAFSEKFARSKELVSRAWSRPIRIRIRSAGIRKTRLALAGLNQRLRLKNFSSHGDSRLWTSMAMATLSALLALAVVTGVRRYVPTANASTTKHPTNSLSVEQVVTPAPAATPRSKPHSTKTSPVVHAKTAQPAPVTRTASVDTKVRESKALAPKPAARKRRLSEEDDYIAKDTYVVYGANGKPVRR